MGAWVLDRLGVQGWAIADYPERLGRWPAVVGFAFYVWLELVIFAGPATLFIVLVGYTALTLAMMAQFGRDEWRSHGETFTVWFRTLGRLAHWRLVDEDGRITPRPFGSGLLEPGWSAADVTLVAFGVSSIIFDGLSQTESFFNLFGAPGIARAHGDPVRVHGHRRPARLRGGSRRSVSARSAPACCRSPSAT